METKKRAPKDATDGAPTQDFVIAEALIEDIVEWRYPPGTWLREREIAARFQVSHAPVREALRHVARAGFVEIVPWRGARVAEIDLHGAHEVLELWKAVFGVVCRLAAERMTPDHHVELLSLLGDYEAAVKDTPDPQVHTAAAFRIGRFIAEACGGGLAEDLLGKMGRLARWQHKLLSTEYIGRYPSPPGQHSARLFRELCGAIVGREPERADAQARALLELTQTHLADALRDRIGELRNIERPTASV